MKTLLKFLFLSLVLAAFAGCAAQKRGGKTELAAVLHTQALKALTDGNFKIEVDQFYLAKGKSKSPIDAVDSYISMGDHGAVMKFAPDLSSNPPYNFENIEDNAAKITLEKTEKNGDVLFNLEMKGLVNFQDRKILITLYKDTNKCFVRVSNERLSYHVVDFTGKVFPNLN